ncbi:uncharacterized protein LOC130589392 [Beta vulgaris subsp. vulgaris]|uniref:uncharacterized protein LOC130589392 n=1 Tax=Beta vulgaris subsp. vulgaris TaxID=3555 RepID=UPI0025470FB0|nr:uncharacterized protein LOC130589392 [Beta vulgaris subsp. vulgaris]
MVDKQCSKHFPKRFIDSTKVDDEGYPFTGEEIRSTVDKGGVHLDNKSVLDMPHIDNTKFLSWMKCNEKYEEARAISYVEFPTRFVWKQALREWTPRNKGFAIGRIYHVSPGSGEKFYLRTLLNFVKGATCNEDIRTVDGVVYPTFKEACYARGLLDDDKEYVDAITEASFRESGHYVRHLFSMLLLSRSMSKPEDVWHKTWRLLSDDILYKQRGIQKNKELQLTDDQIEVFASAEIETMLQSNGNSLRRFSEKPFPDELIMFEGQNKLIADELSYDIEEMTLEHDKLFKGLTDEQSIIYHRVMDAVSSQEGGVFFVYGYGGTGKTYVWKTLCAAARKMGEIVLPVASSGIVSLLLPREERRIRDLVLTLTRNMRLQSGSSKSSADELREFSEWIRNIGDGKAGGPNDGEAVIEVAKDILIDLGLDPISAIVDSTYPNLHEHIWEAKYFQERAILAPTNEIVEIVNDHVLSTIHGEEKVYLSLDA